MLSRLCFPLTPKSEMKCSQYYIFLSRQRVGWNVLNTLFSSHAGEWDKMLSTLLILRRRRWKALNTLFSSYPIEWDEKLSRLCFPLTPKSEMKCSQYYIFFSRRRVGWNALNTLFSFHAEEWDEMLSTLCLPLTHKIEMKCSQHFVFS